jgi:hypothetical protein
MQLTLADISTLFSANLKMLFLRVICQQCFVVMSSNERMMSTNDIELCAVVKDCVTIKLLTIVTLKQV